MWVVNNKLVFIAHPRMASRCIRNALTKHYGAIACGTHHAIDTIEIDRQRKRGASIGCVVRNPYDVLVSWYFHNHYRIIKEKTPTFYEFLLDLFENGNGYDVQKIDDKIVCDMYPGCKYADYVIRFEHMQSDFDFWIKRAQFPSVKLKIDGRSEARKGTHYTDFYDSKSRELVEHYFGKEIKQFAYNYEN